jgi:hypothetical protein
MPSSQGTKFIPLCVMVANTECYGQVREHRRPIRAYCVAALPSELDEPHFVQRGVTGEVRILLKTLIMAFLTTPPGRLQILS